MGTKGEYGEGNYKASKQYNDATKQFVESGKVDQAAKDAAPETEIEAAQMANAEAAGRRRAKEEDPALRGEQTQTRDSGRRADTAGGQSAEGMPKTNTGTKEGS